MGEHDDDCLRTRLRATAVIDGEASELELTLVRRHVAWCGECRLLVARHEALAEAIRSAPRPVVGTVDVLPPRRRGAPRVAVSLLVAAGLAAGAIIGLTTRDDHTPSYPVPTQSGPVVAQRIDDARPG